MLRGRNTWNAILGRTWTAVYPACLTNSPQINALVVLACAGLKRGGMAGRSLGTMSDANRSDAAASSHGFSAFAFGAWGTPLARTRGVELGAPWPSSSLRAMTLGIGKQVVRARAALGSDGDAAAKAWLHQADWPALPIRVGFGVPDETAELLLDAPGAIDVEWYSIPKGQDPERACRHFGLDCVLTSDADGGLQITTLENRGMDSGWYDWGNSAPLSYITAFPVRLDCSRVTLPGSADGEPWLDIPQAIIVRALIEAAAVLSRSPARLTIEDELNGRRVVGMMRPRQAAFGRYPTGRDPVQYVLKRLVSVIEHASRGTVAATRAERTAARVAAAFLATPLAKVDDITRFRGLETAARVAGDEPEVMLRLSAVRFSCMRDVAAMDALLRADRMLRNAEMHPGVDNLAFLMSELEHGPDESLTLGRVAAGITLLSAGKSLQELIYLRDEVLDDMRFSRWLSGREQDQALLADIFRNLERSRRGEHFALPMGNAAEQSRAAA